MTIMNNTSSSRSSHGTTALSPTTRVLHWLVAFFIVVLLCVGYYMAWSEDRSPMPLHKSFGMLALVVILPRVVWRLMEGWPQPAGTYSGLEQLLARITHWALLIGSVLMPVSGMMMSAAGGRGLSLFGLTLLAANPDPANPGKVIALNKGLAGQASAMHETLALVLAVALLLHIVGALKHHLIDKDRTLPRMLGR